MVVIWKVVLFGQKLLYSGESCCIGAKIVVFGQNGCNRAKWLYSGKVVVFGQKWLYLDKSGCTRAKVVVFWQKWLYSGKVIVFR